MLEYLDKSYLEIIKKTDQTKYKSIHAVVLSNITLKGIEPFFQYLANDLSLTMKLKFGRFNTVLQDALSSDKELINSETEMVFVTMFPKTYFYHFIENSPIMSKQLQSAELQRLEVDTNNIIDGIRKKSNANVFFQLFEMPIYSPLGISQNTIAKGFISEANLVLENIQSRQIKFFTVDPNPTRESLGEKKYYDWRYWHIARMPYSLNGLKGLAFEYFKYIRVIYGKNKKCFVLDCDNTLWGGIIGEGTLEEIEIGDDHPGSLYQHFQTELKSLKESGATLALCSKNNEGDVWKVFDQHPGMVLRREDFSSHRINWENKADNIVSIANELNISLDSIVFIDDNIREIELVKLALPEIECIHFDKNLLTVDEYILYGKGLFGSFEVTHEDSTKSSLFQNESKRKKSLPTYSNIEDYLRSLNMEIKFSMNNESFVPRVSQLTQKTNQFSLTTKRYTQEEVRILMRNKQTDVISVQLKDKFGDYGTIGVAILVTKNFITTVDTFLLSCRALGKCVEQVLLQECLELSFKRKSKTIMGSYIKTERNSQVANFYPLNNFLKSGNNSYSSTNFGKNFASLAPDYFIVDKTC